MICPKCGFQQPDDMYCAFCGVNIETHLKQRKKRRYRTGILCLLIGVAVLFAAYHMAPFFGTRVSDKAGEEESGEDLAQSSQESEAGLPSRKLADARPASGRVGTDTPQSGGLRREAREAQRAGRGQARKDETGLRPSLHGERREVSSEDTLEEGARTASEWFEEGRALDDDSDEEIEFYKKAIEADGAFAPAHYRLGAIYYRQADYDLADHEFGAFLEHASDADKEIYNIYEYYSYADVRRLVRSKEEESGAEKEGKAREAREEREEREEKKEIPAKPESEREHMDSDTTGRETNEQVMTVVNFLPVEGHIMVPVILNESREAKVLVDTGAGITILSKELARELGLEMRSGRAVTLKTIGTDVQGEMARLDSIQVGTLIRNNFPVAIADLSLGEKSQFDAILGMDFMADYKIHIDNEQRRIVLSPKAQ